MLGREIYANICVDGCQKLTIISIYYVDKKYWGYRFFAVRSVQWISKPEIDAK
jgi:hypothetical protein